MKYISNYSLLELENLSPPQVTLNSVFHYQYPGKTIPTGRVLTASLGGFRKCAISYVADIYYCTTYCYVDATVANINSFNQPGVYPIYSKYISHQSWPYTSMYESYMHMGGCNAMLKALGWPNPSNTEFGGVLHLLFHLVNRFFPNKYKEELNRNLMFRELLLAEEFTLHPDLLEMVLSYLFDPNVNSDCADIYGGVMNIIDMFVEDYDTDGIAPSWHLGNLISRVSKVGSVFDPIFMGKLEEPSQPIVTQFSPTDYQLWQMVVTTAGASDYGFHVIPGSADMDISKPIVMYDVFKDQDMLQGRSAEHMRSMVSIIAQLAMNRPEFQHVTQVYKTRNEMLTIIGTSPDGLPVVRQYDLMAMMLVAPQLLYIPTAAAELSRQIWPT